MTNKQAYAGLLPCPFCGSREDSPIESAIQLCHNEYHREYNPDGDTWTVQCDNCTATMGDFSDPDEAIIAWNTRPEAAEAISSLLKRVGELEIVLTELRPHFEFLAGKPQFPSAKGLLELIDAALNSDAPLSIGEEQ